MRTSGLVSTLILAGALTAGGASAQVSGPFTQAPGGGRLGQGGFPQPNLGAASPRQLELHHLYQEYVVLRRQQSELEAQLRAVRTEFTDEAPQVVAAMKALDANKEALTVVKQRFEEESERSKRDYRRSAILLTRASIDLQNATVRQAAEALSRATRVAIQVDAQVPENLRLTVNARGITLGAVLEAVARQASLKVAPSEGGVTITTWPMVGVNGQTQVFKGPWAPWATEWGQLPGTLSTNGWSFPGEPDGSGVAADPAPMVGLAPGGGGYPGLAAGQPSPGVFPGSSSAVGAPPRERSASLSGAAATASSLTALGDRQIALAEPGKGPAGQQGVWISVYRLEGTQLKKIATAFHALKSDSSGMAMPGMGGMPGAGGGSMGLGGMAPPGGGGAAPGMPGFGGNPFGGGGIAPTPSSRPLGAGAAKPGASATPKTKPTTKK